MILGPLLIIFLVGIAFDNSNTYSLNIGVYSPEYDDMINSFVDKLNENEFKVIKTTSEEQCILKIKEGAVHTCIMFTGKIDLSSNDAKNEIVFHIDYSKMNLVWMVMDTLSSKLQARSSELSADMTNSLLKRIEETKAEIFNKNPTLAELKKENEEITNIVSETHERLGNLDFSAIGFGFSDFDTKVKSSNTRFNEVKTYVLEKVALGKKYVESAGATLSASNDSDSSLVTDVNNIGTILTNIETKLNQASNNTDAEWGEITSLLSTLRDSLNNLESRLSTSKTFKDDMHPKLGTSKEKLGSSLNKLNELQQSFGKISEGISSIQVTKAENIVNPITTTIKPVTAEKTHLNYLFPGLIILVVMFTSILLGTTLVMMEKHSPAYFRNIIAPTKDATFVLATYLTNIIIVLTQIIFIILISTFFFGSQIIYVLHNLLLILFLVSTLFSFIGMLIGYIFTSEETGMLGAISVSSILLLISNMILPIESMPEYVMNIARFNPFVLGQTILQRIVIFNTHLKVLLPDASYLIAYSIIMYGIILIVQKDFRKNYLISFVHKKRKKNKEKKEKAVAKKTKK